MTSNKDTSGKMTKKEILSRLDELEIILRDPRFVPDYKITQARVTVDAIAGPLRKEMKKGFDYE